MWERCIENLVDLYTVDRSFGGRQLGSMYLKSYIPLG